MTSPLSTLVELDLDGVWTDISAYCRVDGGVAQITRGRQDEQAAPSPAQCVVKLNNKDGRFSPRNPTGPYYGLIKRNTPLRVTVTAGAADPSVRFVGEVARWPVSWALSEADVWVSVTANGLRRRLSQGQTPLRGALERAISALPNLVAYWPMDDPNGSTTFASAVNGVAAMTVQPPVAFGGDTTHFPAHPGMPVINGGSAYAEFPYTAAGEVQARVFAYVPSGLSGTGGNLISVYFTGGNIGRVSLDVIQSTGVLFLQMWDLNGVYVGGSGFVGPTASILDTPVRLTMAVKQNGANVDMRVDLTAMDGSNTSYTGSMNSKTLGSAYLAMVAAPPYLPAYSAITGITLGHFTVQDDWTSTGDLVTGIPGVSALDAYTGEAAFDRITRLSTEEGITVYAGGPSTNGGAAMGPQRPGTLLDLLDEAALVDGGILTEQIDALAFVYTLRDDLYNQVPTAVMDYAGRDLAVLEPVEDDQRTVNDLTVTRTGGSSARYVRTDGPLSTAPPPVGIGRYDSALELNVETDAQLPDQASWRVWLGTVDEPRYPAIGMDLIKATDPFPTGDLDALLALREGHAVQVDNPPAFAGAPDDIRQLVAGWREVIGTHVYEMVLCGIPATPYDVGVYDDEGDGTYPGLTLEPGSRYSPDECVTAEALDATETAIDVTTTGPIWTTDPAEYPLDLNIGGERITAGGCTGSTASQTFTGCTRSVNGVVKTHAAGAEVALWQPARYAL